MPKIDIDLTGLLRTVDATNTLYLVPAKERDNSQRPLVCVFGSIGSGMPSHAYHHRWRYLGKVASSAIPEYIEEQIWEHKDTILAIAELYEGHSWDGHNHVGRWREDARLESAGYEIQEALHGVAQYWKAADYFAPLGNVDQRMRELATLDQVQDVVRRELEEAPHDVCLLDEDVQRELVSDAQLWLDRHEDAADAGEDTEEDKLLRARLEGWLKQ